MNMIMGVSYPQLLGICSCTTENRFLKSFSSNYTLVMKALFKINIVISGRPRDRLGENLIKLNTELPMSRRAEAESWHQQS